MQPIYLVLNKRGVIGLEESKSAIEKASYCYLETVLSLQVSQ